MIVVERQYDVAHLRRPVVSVFVSGDWIHGAVAEARDRFVALTSHASERGGGVTVSRFWKSGAIDYKKIPELKTLDLEAFRGAPREKMRITTTTG